MREGLRVEPHLMSPPRLRPALESELRLGKGVKGKLGLGELLCFRSCAPLQSPFCVVARVMLFSALA